MLRNLLFWIDPYKVEQIGSGVAAGCVWEESVAGWRRERVRSFFSGVERERVARVRDRCDSGYGGLIFNNKTGFGVYVSIFVV